MLNIQTDDAEDARGGTDRARPTTSAWCALQREVGRSSYGAIFVNRQGTGDDSTRARRLEPRLWRGRQHPAVREPADLGVHGAHRHAGYRPTGAEGSDYSGRAFYNFTNNLWQISGGYSQVGEHFNPEVGFLPRRGYRRPEFRAFFQPQPKNIEWIRRIAPHMSYNSYYGFDGELQTESWHLHAFEIQPMQGGRFGWFAD